MQEILQPTNVARDHPLDSIIGDISRGIQTFISSIEPKKIDETLNDVDWVNTMHEELNNFTRNHVWKLVDRPKNHNMMTTKWVF
jgi:predicted transcriptional regulator YheO